MARSLAKSLQRGGRISGLIYINLRYKLDFNRTTLRGSKHYTRPLYETVLQLCQSSKSVQPCFGIQRYLEPEFAYINLKFTWYYLAMQYRVQLLYVQSELLSLSFLKTTLLKMWKKFKFSISCENLIFTRSKPYVLEPF